MNNNQIRSSVDRHLEVFSAAGATAAGIYGLFVGWTHQEVKDPSDPTKRLGIVQPELNGKLLRELTDPLLSAATGGQIPSKTFEYGRKPLAEHGFIAQLRLSHGQRIVIRNSEKFLFPNYTVNEAPAWVYEIEEFSDFKPAHSSLKSQNDAESSLNIRDVIPKNSGSHEVKSGSHEVKSGSLEVNSMTTQEVTSLGGFRKYIGEKERSDSALLNTESGQGISATDAPNFVREITKAVQKIAPSVVLLPSHRKQLIAELRDTSLHPLPTLDELLKVATAEADDWGSDDFKIGQGANLLIAKLINAVQIAREHKEAARKTAEIVTLATAREQETVRQEFEAARIAAEEEAALVEDTL